MGELFRLKVPKSLVKEGSRIVACGDAAQLGSWRPDVAPALQAAGDDWVLLAENLNGAPPRRADFKFVIVPLKGQPKWEQLRPNRNWPQDDSQRLLHWDQVEAFEGGHGGRTGATVDAERELFRVLVADSVESAGAAMVACGDAAQLGGWRPDAAPLLQRSKDGKSFVLLGKALPQATMPPPEALFKLVLIPKKGPALWEQSRPNRKWPQDGEAPELHWDELEDSERAEAAAAAAAAAEAVAAAPAPAAAAPSAAPAAAPAVPAQPSGLELHKDAVDETVAIRLMVPDSLVLPLGAKIVACGGEQVLGGWNLKAAPALESLAPGEWGFPLASLKAVPGAEFKFAVLPSKGEAQWENLRPNRRWPQAGEPNTLHWNELEEWEGGQGRRPKRKALRQEGAELELSWGSKETPGASASCLACGPAAIFHAFNWRWPDVGKHAGMIAGAGFDAVQLSPAQRSKSGDQWWTRYQPQRYDEIHGLGSEDELRQACSACQALGLQVIGDVVFNHMLVVASADEWRRAQTKPALLEDLKKRLEKEVGPAFDREDFQWPWFELQGTEWDGPMRMEGWGCGEWSELKAGSPKVVAAHRRHLEILRKAGVAGFRFDAAKHMRPAHLADYATMARSLASGGEAFTYGEVLSFDAGMQQEYLWAASEKATAAPAPDQPWPTTDFSLAAWLRWFLVVPDRFYGENGTAPAPSSEAMKVEVPLLARNSVRFARNHDNVEGDADLHGLGSWDPEVCAVATAWLLACHDGVVHVLHKDVESYPIIPQAAQYRKAFRARLASKGLLASSSLSTEVRVRLAKGGGAPLHICLALRAEGKPLGFCVLNPDGCDGPSVDFRGAACLASSAATAFAAAAGPNRELSANAAGELSEPLSLPPRSGLFFLAKE